MSKPSKNSILASKIVTLVRECSEEQEFTAVELYSLQMVLKEELSRSWLFDVMNAADRTAGVLSLSQKQRYEVACQSVGEKEEKEVHERHRWLETKLSSYSRLSSLYQSQQHSSLSKPSLPSVIRLVPTVTCAHVADELLFALSLALVRNPSAADVDLVTLSHEISDRLNRVPLKRLMFTDLDKYLNELAIESRIGQLDGQKEGQRVKCLLLMLEKRLAECEERMSQFLLSIEKRKGCWLREVSRLRCEVRSGTCRPKVPALTSSSSHHLLVCRVDFKEAEQALDSLIVDSSITAEDDLDLNLRLLEQKIRSD